MKQVIHVCEPDIKQKPIEFTHILSTLSGWVPTNHKASDYNMIVYLGNCPQDGDMFAAYDEVNKIFIFKGHLNDGVY